MVSVVFSLEDLPLGTQFQTERGCVVERQSRDEVSISLGTQVVAVPVAVSTPADAANTSVPPRMCASYCVSVLYGFNMSQTGLLVQDMETQESMAARSLHSLSVGKVYTWTGYLSLPTTSGVRHISQRRRGDKGRGRGGEATDNGVGEGERDLGGEGMKRGVLGILFGCCVKGRGVECNQEEGEEGEGVRLERVEPGSPSVSSDDESEDGGVDSVLVDVSPSAISPGDVGVTVSDVSQGTPSEGSLGQEMEREVSVVAEQVPVSLCLQRVTEDTISVNGTLIPLGSEEDETELLKHLWERRQYESTASGEDISILRDTFGPSKSAFASFRAPDLTDVSYSDTVTDRETEGEGEREGSASSSWVHSGTRSSSTSDLDSMGTFVFSYVRQPAAPAPVSPLHAIHDDEKGGVEERERSWESDEESQSDYRPHSIFETATPRTMLEPISDIDECIESSSEGSLSLSLPPEPQSPSRIPTVPGLRLLPKGVARQQRGSKRDRGSVSDRPLSARSTLFDAGVDNKGSCLDTESGRESERELLSDWMEEVNSTYFDDVFDSSESGGE
ncbi:hypothetical protein KIPB_007078 [Kipferlia bialata]|uniref:Uncharacterized protein n=1 Tax=Kipferlia bialata TaxID=797122 RepID=A0A9K3CZH9_9EUKA|nr:hypothetical protein KIPB_007078 [Kipferlia bialata]|eukprot:g7078.t1